MKIRIVADSSSDLHELSGVEYVSVPLKIVTEEKEYIDDKDLDISDMVETLKKYKKKCGTACPGQGDWMEAFGDADWIFGITITSKLSGSYNAARLAKEEYLENHPEKKVYIIDSYSTGPGMILMIEKLKELIKAGKAFDAICEEIEAYKKQVGLIFCLESINNLANNGRVNHAVAKIAGVLGIRIVGIEEDGDISLQAKCRGEKGALSEIVKITKNMGCSGQKIIINHCLNEAAAEKLKTMLQAEYPDAQIVVGKNGGLCSFYAEKGGMIIGFEER